MSLTDVESLGQVREVRQLLAGEGDSRRGALLFEALYQSWSHSASATLSICFLAQVSSPQSMPYCAHERDLADTAGCAPDCRQRCIGDATFKGALHSTSQEGGVCVQRIHHTWLACFAKPRHLAWAQAYEHASDLIGVFREVRMGMETLVQIDRLVQILETPVFTFMRLHLLQPAQYPALLRSAACSCRHRTLNMRP